MGYSGRTFHSFSHFATRVHFESYSPFVHVLKVWGNSETKENKLAINDCVAVLRLAVSFLVLPPPQIVFLSARMHIHPFPMLSKYNPQTTQLPPILIVPRTCNEETSLARHSAAMRMFAF